MSFALLHYFDQVIMTLLAMGAGALIPLIFIARKVSQMTTAMESLNASITALQASVNDLKARLAAALAVPAPVPAPVVDDSADVAAAQAIVDSMKTEVDSLVPAAH